jgi:D-threo-aldose 1-dehydrogenase
MADAMTETRLALGCAQLGNLYSPRTDQQARAILEAAWDVGVRHFDTAPHYGLGLSERRLGDFLREKPRDQFTISTKVGRLLVPDFGGAGRLDSEGFVVPAAFRRVWDFSAAGVRASLDASLQRLGLDRVDTVLIHDPETREHVHQALTAAAPALARLQDDGVIRSFGVGTKDAALLTSFVQITDIDTIMLAGRYTLLDQSGLDGLLPACLERGVSVLNAAIFNSGILALPEPDAASHFEYGEPPRSILNRAAEIAAICRVHQTTLPAAAVAFAASHPAVSTLVVGADDAQQVRANSELLASAPPAALWTELISRGLIRADAPLPWKATTYGQAPHSESPRARPPDAMEKA